MDYEIKSPRFHCFFFLNMVLTLFMFVSRRTCVIKIYIFALFFGYPTMRRGWLPPVTSRIFSDRPLKMISIMIITTHVFFSSSLLASKGQILSVWPFISATCCPFELLIWGKTRSSEDFSNFYRLFSLRDDGDELIVDVRLAISFLLLWHSSLFFSH